jgi:hypothetical protein
LTLPAHQLHPLSLVLARTRPEGLNHYLTVKLLPWVHCPNLASRVLGLVCRRLAADWFSHYGYRPVLLETFVQLPRFTGTAYRAANWRYVGLTKAVASWRNTIKPSYHRKPFSFIHCGPISKRSSHAESQRLHRIFTSLNLQLVPA